MYNSIFKYFSLYETGVPDEANAVDVMRGG